MPLTSSHRASHSTQGSSLNMSEDLKARRWRGWEGIGTHPHVCTQNHHKNEGQRYKPQVITSAILKQEGNYFLSIVVGKQAKEAF